MAPETKDGADMRFGKRLTPSDDQSLAKAISDAAAVGVSRDEIQKIIDSVPEGLRTIDGVEHAIEQIEALKAGFLANDVDDGDLLVEPTNDASLVPDHQIYQRFNEQRPALLPSNVAAEFSSHTGKETVSEGVEFQHPVNTSTANAGSRDQNMSNAYDRSHASQALAKLRLDNVTQTSKRLRAVPFSEMLSYVEELVPDLIEKGVATVLYGLDGPHMSQLALQLGLCIQAGLEVFGKQTAQATFVYLDYENGEREVARRVRKMNSRLGLSSLSNGYYHDFRTPQSPRINAVAPQEIAQPLATVSDVVHLEPFYHDLREYLRTIPGHKFVVADSTHDFLRFSDQAEISETAVKAALTTLDDLCAATDTTMLYLLRRSLSGKNDWSWIWENMAQARLSVNELDEAKDIFVLTVEKKHNHAAGRAITLHWSDGILIPSADLGEEERNELLFETCVQFACTAADMGSPVQRQKDFTEWQLDEIERKAGVRPSEREAKQQLENAINVGRLRYVKDGGRLSGFYRAETHLEKPDTIDAFADQTISESLYGDE